jgi:hypothetical protein
LRSADGSRKATVGLREGVGARNGGGAARIEEKIEIENENENDDEDACAALSMAMALGRRPFKPGPEVEFPIVHLQGRQFRL